MSPLASRLWLSVSSSRTKARPSSNAATSSRSAACRRWYSSVWFCTKAGWDCNSLGNRSGRLYTSDSSRVSAALSAATLPWLSRQAASAWLRSKRASSWPFLTRSPSCTSTASISPSLADWMTWVRAVAMTCPWARAIWSICDWLAHTPRMVRLIRPSATIHRLPCNRGGGSVGLGTSVIPRPPWLACIAVVLGCGACGQAWSPWGHPWQCPRVSKPRSGQ